jgi:hypothetical protein
MVNGRSLVPLPPTRTTASAPVTCSVVGWSGSAVLDDMPFSLLN